MNTRTFCVFILCNVLSLVRGWVPILSNGLLPSSSVLVSVVPSFLSREALAPGANVASAISKLYPLPQEELTKSYNRGNAYLMSGQFEKALSEFNRAVDVSPKTADAVFSRGIAREKLLDWEGAIADYRSANDLYKVSFAGLKGPDDATCMNNIANAEAGMERWSDALKTYDYAIKLDSRPVAPKLGRALVQYQLGSESGDTASMTARDALEEIAIKFPTFPDVQAALAGIYYAEGRVTASRVAWEVALENDSRYSDIEWVREYRRWPPRLVQKLEALKSDPNR